MGRNHDGYGASAANGIREGVLCNTCKYYNFDYRLTCRICKERLQRPKGQEAQRTGKGNGKGSNTGATRPIENAWTARKLKEVEERNRVLEKQLEETKGKTEQGTSGGDDTAEMELDVDPELSADVRKLDELQKQHDQLATCFGADDRTVKDLKARLDRARASKRGELSISAQIVTAERRRAKLGKSIESARKEQEDFEKKRDEMDEKAQGAAKRKADMEQEAAKVDGELETLHKRALAEKEGKPCGEQDKAEGEKEEAGRTDAGTAWRTLIEETKARVHYPGARPELASEAEQLFTMVQTFLQQLPKEVLTISENGNTRCNTNESTQGSTICTEACKGHETDDDEWSEEDFDAIEIDEVPGETEVQRKERKKSMCKQVRQAQGKVALRKKEKAKGVATKCVVESKQKANKENKE